ncbi:YcxB family protein [Flavobacterium sp.]|uniref:YcxB family protein n=1 Tax=Flavobacterium sp. TaxID=239 RepID=UPI003C61F2AA
MKIQYALNENDFLEHQLFTASKTERINKQRRKSWIMVTFSFFALSILFLNNENRFLLYYFLGFGVISLIFYPLYQRNHYKRHYRNFIKETYKNRFNETATLIFEEDYIETNDLSGETKIYYSAFEETNEIKDYYFLKLKTGGSIIIPKMKIDNIENFKIELNRISEKYNLKNNVELNWKWK